MVNARGQTSVELMVLLVASLAILATIFTYASTHLSQLGAQQNLQTGQTSLNDLVNAANDVYNQGVGARKVVFIRVPEGIRSGNSGIAGKTVYWRVVDADLFARAHVNLSGTLPLTPGGHYITIESKEGFVVLGVTKISFNATSFSVSMNPDSNASRLLRITFSGSGDANVVIAKTWTSSTVSLDVNETGFSVPANASRDVNVLFKANASAVGNMAGQLKVDVNYEGTFETFLIPLNVEVSANSGGGALFLFPADFNLNKRAGQSDSNSLQVCNASSGTLVNIHFPLSTGNAGDWFSGISTIPSLGPNQCTSKTLTYTVPSSTVPGAYQGTIVATDNYNSDYTAVNFTVIGMADDFNFSWGPASFSGGGYNLNDWLVGNKGNGVISIDRMTVSSFNTCDTGQGVLTQINLNGSTVWSGSAADGNQVNITDFNIPVLTSYSANNRLVFSSDVNNEGEQFTIAFAFADGTAFTSPVYGSGCNVDANAPSSVALSLTTSGLSGGQIKVQWTAPGDDGNTGTASSYDLRYSTSASITDDTTWANATQVSGEPAPSSAGTAESFTLSNLSPGTTYYFALKTTDNAGNISGLSNSPSSKPNTAYVISLGSTISDIPRSRAITLFTLSNISGADTGRTLRFKIVESSVDPYETWDINIGFGRNLIIRVQIDDLLSGQVEQPGWDYDSGALGIPSSSGLNFLNLGTSYEYDGSNVDVNKPNTLTVTAMEITGATLNIDG